MRLNFTLTNNSITLFYKGRLYNIPSTFRKFDELKEHLRGKEHDESFIESIVNVKEELTRLSEGNVTIKGNSVYYKGTKIHTYLAERLVQLFDDGFDVTPWVHFMENVMLNPSQDSRERLFTFLEKNGSPFTEDGHFLAFKRIRKDWKDIYSGTMDNSVGKIVEVPRESVDANNNITCSRGLHVAASIYLNSYARPADSRTIVCKVNPKDVVAVPPDYNETKMRVCRYEVLSEVEVGSIKDVETTSIYVDPNKPAASTENDQYFEDYSGWDREYEENDNVVDGENDDVGVHQYVKNTFKGLNVETEYEADEYKASMDVVVNISEKDFAKHGYRLIALSDDLEHDDVDFWDVVFKTPSFSFYVDNTEAVTNGGDTYYMEHMSESEFNEMIDLMIEYEVFEISDEKDDATENDDVSEGLVFKRNGSSYTSKEILDGVADFGSITRWAKSEGIPRSTAQDWVKKITNS